MCRTVKCANPECEVRMQACQTINGYCAVCWDKLNKVAKQIKKCLPFI